MCHFCTTHADGGKWIENAANFSAKMYSNRKKKVAKEEKFTQHMGGVPVKIDPEKGRITSLSLQPPVIKEDFQAQPGSNLDLLKTRSDFSYFINDKGEVQIPPGMPADLDIMFTDLLKEVVDATGIDVESLPQMKRKVASFMGKYHFGN